MARSTQCHSVLRAAWGTSAFPIPRDSCRLGKGVKNLGVCLNCVRKGLNIASWKSNVHTRRVCVNKSWFPNPISTTPGIFSLLQLFLPHPPLPVDCVLPALRCFHSCIWVLVLLMTLLYPAPLSVSVLSFWAFTSIYSSVFLLVESFRWLTFCKPLLNCQVPWCQDWSLGALWSLGGPLTFWSGVS